MINLLFSVGLRDELAVQGASDLADATVVHQIRTRHVGTLVGRQEERRAGNFLGPSESTDRDHAQVHVHQSLALSGGRRLRVENRSVGYARAERVDADAATLEFRSPGTGIRTQCR